MTEQEMKARAIAESYLTQTKADAGALAMSLTGEQADRLKYIKKYAGRFARALEARCIDNGVPFNKSDMKFMVMELFSRLDVMKPIEMIGAFKLIGEWAGLGHVPERVLNKNMYQTPNITFRKVGT